MILLLGGTAESGRACNALLQKNHTVLYTSTTNYPFQFEEGVGTLERLITSFDDQQLELLIRDRNITHIVDATHPYALEISERAATVAEKLEIPCIRFEREIPPLPESPWIIPVATEAMMFDALSEISGNILVTLGVKSIVRFQEKLPSRIADCYFRVLPTTGSIQQCETAGIKPSHIIAMVGPFDREWNEYLIRRFKIRAMVTKETGKEGGFMEKVDACINGEIPLIVIRRPQSTAKVRVFDTKTLIELMLFQK